MQFNCLPLLVACVLTAGIATAQNRPFKNTVSADLTGVLRNTADMSYERKVYKNIHLVTRGGYMFSRDAMGLHEYTNNNPGFSTAEGWFAGAGAKLIIPGQDGMEIGYGGIEYLHSTFSEKSRSPFAKGDVPPSFGTGIADGISLSAGLISSFSTRFALETGIRYNIIYGDFSNVNKNTDVMGLLQGYPIPGLGRAFGASEASAFQIMIRMKYRFGSGFSSASDQKPNRVLKKAL